MTSRLVKQLAGDTVIYGLSSVLGRAMNFLLLPLFTTVFTPEEYGIQTLVYSYAAVFFVIYLLRMEVAYFRFVSDEKWSDSAYTTAQSTVTALSIVFSLVLFVAAPWWTRIMNIDTEYSILVRLMAVILFFDAMSEVPYAQLRHERRATRFALIRLTNISLNLIINGVLLYLIPLYLSYRPSPSWLSWYEGPELLYIFIANAVASFVAFLLLYPQWRGKGLSWDKQLLREMLLYAWPLAVVSLAGIINELIDRVMLDRYLPYDDVMNKAQTGIYAAAYKFSILIALFTQAFRYAAEPFFFKNAKDKQAPQLYALVAQYFVYVACLGFLSIMFFMPWLQGLLRSEAYREGVSIIAILLMAQVCLGLYYNLSVWYKLTDKTVYAMYIAIGGALLTILLNRLLIPIAGYTASASITLICYASMCAASYLIGRRFYPMRQPIVRIVAYMLGAYLLYVVTLSILDEIGLAYVFRIPVYLGILISLIVYGWKNLRRDLSILNHDA